MKKRFAVVMLLCVSLMLFGCGSSKTASEPIVGSWTAIGVMYDGEYTSFSGDEAINKAMADLYDTQYVTFDADGTYQMQSGAFAEDGKWTKQENQEGLSYAYMMTAEDGDQKLAGVMDDDTSVMMVYDMDMDSDQVMLVYGKDGADTEHVYFDYGDYLSDDNDSDSDDSFSYDAADSYNSDDSYSYDSNDSYSSYDSGSSYDSYGSVTSGESNALQKAWDYLDYMAFSYEGLIDQLEYEGFTSSEAKYAADNCGADWYDQAAKKAQEYLDYMAFSRSELIDQLEYEGFTYDQASYGVNAVY